MPKPPQRITYRMSRVHRIHSVTSRIIIPWITRFRIPIICIVPWTCAGKDELHETVTVLIFYVQWTWEILTQQLWKITCVSLSVHKKLLNGDQLEQSYPTEPVRDLNGWTSNKILQTRVSLFFNKQGVKLYCMEQL